MNIYAVRTSRFPSRGSRECLNNPSIMSFHSRMDYLLLLQDTYDMLVIE